ncbi:hypothetical protein TRFO_25609 [Tritrichomonas foetus]|uniref:Uncharacterized protein n=1 Tax=Tritrichomonas foetus TaxID=1144522 RepID=A0A1J4K4G4_9EUKA|nr:hypothetical protein TRFO_25609 [Tritrichomonas foetus]|eukprot:OHT06337.1 hypothetical protein TRFO_25609 [Tritrichomonas foetus]
MRSRTKAQTPPSNRSKSQRSPNSFEYLYQDSLTNHSIPYSNIRNNSPKSSRERSLPRTTKTLSVKKKKVQDKRVFDVPVLYAGPPILAHEEISDEVNDRSYDENELNLHGCTTDDLKRLYKQYVNIYQEQKERFMSLQKKREKTVFQIEKLQDQVRKLTKEQEIVEAEFERLGLGTPKSKENAPHPTPVANS